MFFFANETSWDFELRALILRALDKEVALVKVDCNGFLYWEVENCFFCYFWTHAFDCSHECWLNFIFRLAVSDSEAEQFIQAMATYLF